MIGDTREEYIHSVDVLELVKGGTDTHNIIDLGDIFHFDVALNIINKVAPKRCKSKGCSGIPNQIGIRIGWSIWQ